MVFCLLLGATDLHSPQHIYFRCWAVGFSSSNVAFPEISCSESEPNQDRLLCRRQKRRAALKQAESETNGSTNSLNRGSNPFSILCTPSSHRCPHLYSLGSFWETRLKSEISMIVFILRKRIACTGRPRVMEFREDWTFLWLWFTTNACSGLMRDTWRIQLVVLAEVYYIAHVIVGLLWFFTWRFRKDHSDQDQEQYFLKSS